MTNNLHDAVTGRSAGGISRRRQIRRPTDALGHHTTVTSRVIWSSAVRRSSIERRPGIARDVAVERAAVGADAARIESKSASRIEERCSSCARR